MTEDEFKRVDRILAKALDADLSDWDSDFVNDMADRLEKYGHDAIITPRQWAQINRIEDQYL